MYTSNHTMIRSLTTRFFLTHVTTGCLLRSHNVILPQWGFKQAEVLCQKKPDRTSTFNMWNIEKHVNDRRKTSSSHSLLVPKGGVNQYRSRFLKDFWDLNVAMWTSNNALVPDPDKEPEIITSQAYQWPLALTGLRMCSWDDNSIKFYMIGNPLVWWGGTLSLVIVSGLFLVYIMRQHRQIREWKYEDWSDFVFASKVGILGWFLHYIPFHIMGRVLYLHHYFPALYFSLISLALLVDHSTKRLHPITRSTVYLALGAILVGVYLYFAPFSFGFTGPASDMKGRKWLSSWNVYGHSE